MYFLVNIFIIIDSMFCRFMENKVNLKNFFLITVGLLLIFISSFRGNFTTDYENYKSIFNYISLRSFNEIFSQDVFVEKGYALINKIVSLFTSNYSILLLVLTLMIIIILFVNIYNLSTNVYMSVILLVNFGSYYTSFNTLRQYIVSVLFLISLNFLFERQLLKYVLSILLFSTIHKSILFMLPMYFILPLDFKKKKNILPLFFFFSIYLVIIIFQKSITQFFSSNFYTVYAQQNAFGISNGTPFFVVLRPIFIVLIILFLHKSINSNSIKERVWINSSILFLLTSILSLQVEMFQRFTYFFITSILFIIPNLIGKIEKKEVRITFKFLIYTVVILYGVISNINSPYIFVWNN